MRQEGMSAEVSNAAIKESALNIPFHIASNCFVCALIEEAVTARGGRLCQYFTTLTDTTAESLQIDISMANGLTLSSVMLVERP